MAGGVCAGQGGGWWGFGVLGVPARSHDLAPYVRKVKTSSGATAVQIVEKRRVVRRILEYLGSAHDDAELTLLLQVARETVTPAVTLHPWVQEAPCP